MRSLIHVKGELMDGIATLLLSRYTNPTFIKFKPADP